MAPTAIERVIQFPKDGFVVSNKKLWCSRCCTDINFLKKSAVQQHVKSEKHRKALNALTKPPHTIVNVIDEQNSGKKKWEDMVQAFTSAGVPLHIFQNTMVRSWIENNVKEGSTLPSESTLRTCLPSLGAKDLEETSYLCHDCDVAVEVDETIDPEEESEGKDESEDAFMNEIRIVNINAGDECDDEHVPLSSAKAPIRIQKRKVKDIKGFRDKMLRHEGRDEFDTFGQHVSHELRKLRDNKYVLAQTKRRIYQALIDADLMYLYPTTPSTSTRFVQSDHVNGNNDDEN